MSQAERILMKFGGPQRLARIFRAMGRSYHRVTLYKWTYPRAKGGTGGMIPTAAWGDVFDAARREGIYLTQEDMDPRPSYPKKLRDE